MQLLHTGLDLGRGDTHPLGHFRLALRVLREEFMQRRVEQPDRDRQALHRPEDALEVGPLQGQQLLERLAAGIDGLRQDHLPHRQDPLALEEHMFGPAQPDPFARQISRPLGVFGRVGIGADLRASGTCRPTP